jgi:hypothetical protein
MADELNPATTASIFSMPAAILKQDAVVIDEQENHIVMTLRLPIDVIRDNLTTLTALSEIATGENSWKRYCSMLLQNGNIHVISEDDPEYLLYSMRVPAETGLDNAGLIALDRDDDFSADLAAWLADRAARLKVQGNLDDAP